MVGTVMQHITSERAGVSSARIKEYIAYLKEKRIAIRDILMMRGNDIFFVH